MLLNIDRIEAARRSDALQMKLLTMPSLLLIFFFLVLPLAWLSYLSLLDENGIPTFQHYARLIQQEAYFSIFRTTLEISVIVTLLCTLLSYPTAYLLAQLPRHWAGLLMLGVLVPFWTSLLVRTYAWLVLLQRRGLVNNILVSSGFLDGPISLVHNATGTVIGMVHVMIPYMVLPLYATMRTIDMNLIRASASLGAGPVRAFWTVYLPLSLPGLFAGIILIFVLCLGFYVTPAVLGGGKVVMLAMRIENSVTLYPSWGAASAIGVVLLVITGVILSAVSMLAKRHLRHL